MRPHSGAARASAAAVPPSLPFLVRDAWLRVLWHLLDGQVPGLLPSGERPTAAAGPAYAHPRARRRAYKVLVRTAGALGCTSRALAALVASRWPAIAADLIPPTLGAVPPPLATVTDPAVRSLHDLRRAYARSPPWMSRPGVAPRQGPAPLSARGPPSMARQALALLLERRVDDPPWLTLALEHGRQGLAEIPMPHVPTQAVASLAAICRQATHVRALRCSTRMRGGVQDTCARDDARHGTLATAFAMYAPISPGERARVARMRAAAGRGRHTYGRFVGDDVPPPPLAEPDALQPVPDRPEAWPAHAVPLAFVHPDLVETELRARPAITRFAHAVSSIPLRRLKARIGLETPAYARRTLQLGRLQVLMLGVQPDTTFSFDGRSGPPPAEIVDKI